MQQAATHNLIDNVLARLQALLPAARPIPLHEPDLQPNDWEMVKDCLDSGWVSSVASEDSSMPIASRTF